MNSMIYSGRETIDQAAGRCFKALAAYNETVRAYQNECREIDPLPFIQEEKERMKAKAAEKMYQDVRRQHETILAELDKIALAAEGMETLLDIGEDLQNALAVVKSLGAAMPSNLRFSLVVPFKGQKMALEILKAAYEAGGIDAEPYFKGLIFDADSRIGSLKESAMRLALQPGESLLTAHTFAGELEDFAKAMGVELSTKYGDLVDAQGAMMEQVRAAAGL